MWWAKLAQPFLDHRRVCGNPAFDRTVVDLEVALAKHLFEISIADRITQLPGHRLHDQPGLEMRPLKSSFDWRCILSTMTFRIMFTLHYIGVGISTVEVNSALTKKICDWPFLTGVG